MNIKEKLENVKSKEDKSLNKSLGKYYTPDFIIEYIMKNTVANADVIENPFLKIIDPACGSGYFLLNAYDLLKSIFMENLNELKEIYKTERYEIVISGKEQVLYGNEYWKEKNLHYHILTHCIYGADIDPFAIELTKESLKKKKANFYIEELNIFECDSLIYWENLSEEDITESKDINYTKKLVEFWNKKYDYVIGNPPYIGHKELSKDYKKWLLEEYSEVFRDKSDISFCFFKRIKTILAYDGICGIISSRYFMESPTGINLRSYLMENIRMLEIVDFYGRDVFKGLSIATAIYFFKINIDGEKDYYINIHKLKREKMVEQQKIVLNKKIDLNQFDNFKLPFNRLEVDRWIIIPESLYRIYEKIEQKTEIKLKDIVLSFQGVITGCDKAFVLNKEEIIENEIEIELVKPWIKNKNIEKYNIKKPDLYLIYSNNINNMDDYPNSIMHIKKYKERLKNRRECKSGIREWHYLQWGRTEELFEQRKIVFPYKSRTNRFSIDYQDLYFSADIYGMIIKDLYKSHISLEYLLGILNSNVYEFYFKLFAKKMGKGIYDYYPNSLLDLSIISSEIIEEKIEVLTKKIIDNVDNTDNLKREIDEILMNYFDFSKKEKEIIKKMF